MKVTKPPLSFMGNKHHFRKEFIKILIEQYDDNYIFVDLFGGSGILSYYVKATFPQATVVYNDFDNYIDRLQNIDSTVEVLKELKEFVTKEKIPHNKTMSDKRQECMSIIEKYSKKLESEGKKLDLLTLSPYILYSGSSFHEWDVFKKQSLYNKLPKNFSQFDKIDEYIKVLKTCVITHEDYKEVYDKYKHEEKVVFIIDPPYLDSNVQMYTGKWKQKEYFDIIFLLEQPHYFLFTSDKSGFLSFVDWLDDNFDKTYLKDTKVISKHRNQSQYLHYDDLMIYR